MAKRLTLDWKAGQGLGAGRQLTRARLRQPKARIVVVVVSLIVQLLTLRRFVVSLVVATATARKTAPFLRRLRPRPRPRPRCSTRCPRLTVGTSANAITSLLSFFFSLIDRYSLSSPQKCAITKGASESRPVAKKTLRSIPT